jgi:hypothetical protein
LYPFKIHILQTLYIAHPATPQRITVIHVAIAGTVKVSQTYTSKPAMIATTIAIIVLIILSFVE